ncbi:hypothetical protein FH972_026871 [Carpinus fangiana]|uniref:Inositol polyphosphate-related phosphatase domain-containing protein n=1 Tax=Carpinus fangiana TaxID=176857 RepID=A0A5N6L5N1_9ROSI|nr:hypothetical protein FH972_026871 [Carpinus fangiana]
MAALKTSIVTFNCGKASIEPDELAAHLLSGKDLPDLLVLSLQEIAPLAHAFLTGSFIHPFLRRAWKAVKIAAADRADYEYVFARNVGTTAILLFAVPETRARIHSLEFGGTAAGDHDLSNKGAAAVRLAYDVDHDSTRRLTFVAAHLAPMEPDFERRNKDWEIIASTLVFEPVDGKRSAAVSPEAEPLLTSPKTASTRESGIYEPDTLLFVAGDLNYRISDVKPLPDEHKTFPQPTDSLHSWREGDQLNRERQAGRTLQGLTEPEINFPPTYKYDTGFRWPEDGSEPEIWPWAQHRFPSWCDRILYSDFASGGVVKVNRYTALPLLSSSDHRPVVMDFGIDLAAQEWDTASTVTAPFAINPTWKSRRAAGRRWELAVGTCAYLSLTWEGNGILLASLVGAVGGYAVLSSLINT